MRRIRQIETTLKTARRSRGLTQDQLAEKLRLSVPQISKIERGLCEPGILLALRAGDVLDTSVRELWPSQTVKIYETSELVEREKSAKSE